MITVTQAAERFLQSKLEACGSRPLGPRLSTEAERSNGSGPSLLLQFVESAGPHDEVVVASGGLRLYVDPVVSELVDGRVLDRTLDTSGTGYTLVVRRQGEVV
jgi:Fe-S cluster assembly iron-binding protein IscA